MENTNPNIIDNNNSKMNFLKEEPTEKTSNFIKNEPSENKICPLSKSITTHNLACQHNPIWQPDVQQNKKPISFSRVSTDALQCGMCSKRFKTFFWFKRHIRRNHKKEKQFNCQQCSADFTDEKLYLLHIFNHVQEKVILIF